MDLIYALGNNSCLALATNKKSLVALSVVSLFFSVFLARPLANSSPVWLRKGTYAEYSFVSGGIEFLNESITSKLEGIYRWECISLNEGMAELNVTSKYLDTQDYSSVQVYVDTQTRDTTSLNGSLIGKTFIWLPSHMEKGQSVVLAGKPPDYLIGEVVYVLVGNDHVSTPQGGQNAFVVEEEGTSAIMGIGAYYDLDTGLLISWGPGMGEAILLALGILDLNVSGSITLSDTNIDLGPRVLWPEILVAIIIAIFLGGFIITFIAVYRKRKRLRRTFRSKRSLVISVIKDLRLTDCFCVVHKNWLKRNSCHKQVGSIYCGDFLLHIVSL